MTCTCLRVVAETQVEVAVTNGKMLIEKREKIHTAPQWQHGVTSLHNCCLSEQAARSDVTTQLLSIRAGSRE